MKEIRRVALWDNCVSPQYYYHDTSSPARIGK
jgi:hypothetical protein